MAVYKFAENMLNGRPVPVFDPGCVRVCVCVCEGECVCVVCVFTMCSSSFSPSHSLMRDFTYVNDTVAGVLAALDHTPLQCGEVYNVGSGCPTPLHTMLQLLQQELNITSTIVSCTVGGRGGLGGREYFYSCAYIHVTRR